MIQGEDNVLGVSQIFCLTTVKYNRIRGALGKNSRVGKRLSKHAGGARADMGPGDLRRRAPPLRGLPAERFEACSFAPVPVQSMIRLAQLEHVEHCIQIVEATEQWIPFRHRWLTVLKKHDVREQTLRKP